MLRERHGIITLSCATETSKGASSSTAPNRLDGTKTGGESFMSNTSILATPVVASIDEGNTMKQCMTMYSSISYLSTLLEMTSNVRGKNINITHNFAFAYIKFEFSKVTGCKRDGVDSLCFKIQHFPEVQPSSLMINAKLIHTRCIA